MASFSVDITDVVFAGGRTGYKTVEISNTPSGGVTGTLRGTNSTYFRVAAVESGRTYTISTKQTNDTGSSRTAYLRFTNNNNSSDYVDVNLEQYSVTDMKMYVSGATAGEYGSYTINVSNQTGSTEVLLDIASGYGASGSVVTGSTWLSSILGNPGVTDTGFVRFLATYITNLDTDRTGQIVYTAATAGWTTSLYVNQEGEAPTETLSVEPSRLDYNASGGTSSIAVTYRGSTYNCDTTDVSGWVSVSLSSVMSGVLSGTVTCSTNSSTAQRSGNVVFSDASGFINLPITQLGRAVTLSVSPASLSYTANGSTKTLAVGYSGTLTTNASSMPSWLSQSYVTVDSSHRTYNITASANTSTSARSFDFALQDDNMSLVVPIDQAGASAPTPQLSITPQGSTKNSDSGRIKITVLSSITTNDLSYVISDTSWVSFYRKYVDEDFVRIEFDYSANTSANSRSATITLSAPGYTSAVYTLQQNGSGAQVVSVSPPSGNVGYASGNISVTVTPYTDVTYTINDSWITYSNASSPSTGRYSFNYEANPGSARTGTVTFSIPGYEPATFTLNQIASSGDLVTFSPNVVEFNYLGGRGTSPTIIRLSRNGYNGDLYARYTGDNIPIWFNTHLFSETEAFWNYQLDADSVNDSYTDMSGKVEYYSAETGGYKVGEIPVVWKGTPKSLTVIPDILTSRKTNFSVYVSATDEVTVTKSSSASATTVTLVGEYNTYKKYRVDKNLGRDGYVTFTSGNETGILRLVANDGAIYFPLSGGTQYYMLTSGASDSSLIVYTEDFTTTYGYQYASTFDYGQYLFQVTAPPTSTDRQGTIRFRWGPVSNPVYKTINVYQQAGVLGTSPQSMSFSSNGGSDMATVSFTGSLSYNQASLPSWLSLTEVSSSGDQKVYTINVLRNTGDYRSFNIIFEDDNGIVQLPITQEVGAPAIVVNPSSNVVGENSGTISTSVFGPTTINCSVSGNWVRLVSYSGSTYTFSYDANTSSSSRSATVTFSADGYLPATYRLTQAAGASLKANPTKLKFHKPASTKKISFSNVPSGLVDYSITYIDGSGWLNVSGTGLLKDVSVQENYGSRRRAEIRFSDHNNNSNYVIVYVIQGGDGYDSIWMDTLYYPVNRDTDGNYYYRIVDASTNEEYFRGIAAKPQGWGGNVGGIDIPRLVEDHLYSDFIETNTLNTWNEMKGYCTAEIYNMTASGYPGELDDTFKYWNDWSGYEEMYDYTVCLNDPINGKGCDNMIIPFCVYYDDSATFKIVNTSMNGSAQTVTMPTPAYPFVMTYGSFNYSKTIEFKQDDDIIFSYDMNHCGPGAFVYRNRFGGWDSFLIEGNIIKTDNYAKQNYRKKGEYNSGYSINSLHLFNEKYTDSLDVNTTFEVHTGWLSDEESERLAFHFLSSPLVYFQNFNGDLYESDPFTLVPVRLTNSSAEYKKFRNGRRLVSYTITFEKSNIQKVRR